MRRQLLKLAFLGSGKPWQWVCLLLVLGATGTWFLLGRRALFERPVTPVTELPAFAVPESPAGFTIPPIRESLFLNTSRDATYVGSEACAKCHADEHKSYLHTAHSRSLGEIDLDAEPLDAEFKHNPSGRTYRIYRKSGEFRQRESLRADDGTELVLADHAVRYVIGSGNHSRSYLVEIDGFLFESPVTWYTSRQKWGMSPGYEDNPSQPGFARPTQHMCIICHVGHVEPVDGSLHRMRILEHRIGCERCHGPGSSHVQRFSSKGEATDGPDDSIVDLNRLPRQDREAICAQCHLVSAAQASVRGRSIADFRPSLRLADFSVNYRFDVPDSSMTVEGHLEQMWLSRCYNESETLTCTTCHNSCHDLHATPDVVGRVDYYRAKCLTCHSVEACGLDQQRRRRKSPQDNCVACHMPQSPTNIPHFTFTHHRIGVHSDQQNPSPAVKLRELIPLGDVGHLPEIELQRCLGIAYVELAEGDSDTEVARFYDSLARQLLEAVRQRGLRDPDVDAALAWFYRQDGNLELSSELAQSALGFERLTPAVRCDALTSLSRAYFDQNDPRSAIPILEQLVRIRYDAEDYLLLSLCRGNTGDINGALFAAKRAAKIEPDRPDLQDLLAELYRRVDDRELVAYHKDRSRRLRELLPVVPGKARRP